MLHDVDVVCPTQPASCNWLVFLAVAFLRPCNRLTKEAAEYRLDVCEGTAFVQNDICDYAYVFKDAIV